MFNQLLRIMQIDDLRYVETIPDTLYRSVGKQIIIVRSRGKRSKGAIRGKRFLAYVLDVTGKYRKMTGSKGTVRYFDTPVDAAVAAATFHASLHVSVLQTDAFGALTELALKKRSLEREIEQAQQKLAHLSESIGQVPRTLIEERSPPSLREAGIANLPSFMRRAASCAVRQYVN